MAKTLGFSGGGEIQRVIHAAQSPQWSVGEGQKGQIMATRDSGEIGSPWVITAVRKGRGMQVYFYRPGDDVQFEGEAIGEISGNPREMGRQLRGYLEDAVLE